MTWIKTIPREQAGPELIEAIESQKKLYPKEYGDPVHPTGDGTSSIVASHSLIPEALHHAFATFGALMNPDLPLSRAQHEMITTRVSVLNRCHY
jgi:alkylhydroperoxidase family enzyme